MNCNPNKHALYSWIRVNKLRYGGLYFAKTHFWITQSHALTFRTTQLHVLKPHVLNFVNNAWIRYVLSISRRSTRYLNFKPRATPKVFNQKKLRVRLFIYQCCRSVQSTSVLVVNGSDYPSLSKSKHVFYFNSIKPCRCVLLTHTSSRWIVFPSDLRVHREVLYFSVPAQDKKPPYLHSKYPGVAKIWSLINRNKGRCM